jgi:hypothetical protein
MSHLPTSLVQFRHELERAIAQETPRRRPDVLRLVVVSAVAGAVGLGALGAITVFGTSASSVVERATAALAVPSDAIVHVSIVGRQDNGDGTVSTWRTESWRSTSAPYASRQVEQVGGDRAVETGSTGAGATTAVYDAARNTVYVQHEAASDRSGGVVPGKVLRWYDANGKVHRVVESTRRPSSTGPAEPSPAEEPFRQQVLALLRSGEARETGRTTIGGRSAIRIATPTGGATYFVDADTYDPIEFRTVGESGGTVMRFVVYEQLARDAVTNKLLSVEAQHPDARVTRDTGAFQQAQSRLFPRG